MTCGHISKCLVGWGKSPVQVAGVGAWLQVMRIAHPIAACTRVQSLTRPCCPCATCIWLLHPAPTSAQDGLDSLQLALMLFSSTNQAFTNVSTCIEMSMFYAWWAVGGWVGVHFRITKKKGGNEEEKWIGKKWEMCPPKDSNLEPHACEATVLSPALLSLLALISSPCCVEKLSQNYTQKNLPEPDNWLVFTPQLQSVRVVKMAAKSLLTDGNCVA